MATTTTQAPVEAQLLVSISDLSMVNDIKKAISMLKGVTKVKKQRTKTRIYDPETGEYMNDRAVRDIEQALDDAKHGRLKTYNSVDEFFKEMGL
jgi:hypothetical protein